MKFRTLLLGHRDDHQKARLSQALDAMDPKSRLATAMSIEAKEQRELWDLFADQPADASLFVPSGLEPLREVICHGKNTLPAFNFFQKRFCLSDDDSGELWGYNHSDVGFAVGPGYYVAHGTDDEEAPPGAYVIDYTRLPPKKPDSWPDIIPNEARLGRFVYAGMKDYMRKVSEHVSIGRAYKGGSAMNAWFLLCREDPPEG
ncbi:MAG: hypothetical protein KF718_02955 [Polyangiaceae bacterium]|nr:hypothetical protein [Polyangiaceae bacterium]